MSDTIHLKPIAALAVMILIMVPSHVFSRDNSVRGGVSLGFDYDDRNGDSDYDDYQRIVLSPMMQFESLSERDSFLLRAAPGLRYDLVNSDTDWDGSIRLAADRFMAKSWQLGITNNYLRSDSQSDETGYSTEAVNSSQEVDIPSTDPQLSDNRGRTRYWRNTLNLFSSHFYREGSSLRFSVGYDVLRNDDSGFTGDEDYDRYTVGLRNQHRYNAKWQSTANFEFIRGDFTPADSSGVLGQVADTGSSDLKEYRLLLAVDNKSIARNPLSLSYNYIDTLYDEDLEDDTSIHQLRLTWRRDFSSRLYTNLGGGPSYVKTEGQDDTWGGNGIAEVNYALERGYVNFQVEKSYDVENFSGSSDNGVVDAWDTRFSGSYQLQKYLTLSGYLSYIYEDREQLLASQGTQNYHNDIYGANAGLSYDFLQFYNARIAYTYTNRDSDLVGNDYDDHRILLTLSWEKELFHW